MKTVVELEPLDIEGISETQLAYMEEVLRQDIKNIVRDAKANVRNTGNVRTGSLVNALSSKIKNRNGRLYAIVGIDKKYATFYNGEKILPYKYSHLIEFGTRNISGSFFLTKAVKSNEKKILADLKKAAQQAI